jgi:preprotein translocase subunit SecA
MKANLPVEQAEDVQEARQQRSRQKLNEQKEESKSILSGERSPQGNRPPVEKTAPLKSQKVAGRNDKVSVQYVDGSIKKGVKFKTVEQDIESNKCVLIED